MSVGCRRLIDYSGPDYYASPRWVTDLLLEHEQFEGTILEPCCGDGAMAKVFEERYPGQVAASDLYDRGYGKSGMDATNIQGSWDNIVTNPPFSIANEIVKSALNSYQKKACFFLRLAYAEGQRRHRDIFSVEPPARVWIFPERVSMYPGGVQQKGGGTICFAWWVWDKDHTGPTELKWFPTGRRPKGY